MRHSRLRFLMNRFDTSFVFAFLFLGKSMLLTVPLLNDMIDWIKGSLEQVETRVTNRSGITIQAAGQQIRFSGEQD